MATTRLVQPTPKKLWLAAIKPPMYSVAIMPIIVGTAVAFGETNKINQSIFFTFLISAILILAWENLSNDVFDSETGIDQNKPHSVVNLTGNKSLIFWLSNLCLGLGILGILLIAWWQQDWTVLIIILFCCLLGYTYQGPPFRLGYQGLGEILCFFAFGPLAIAATYYSQTQSFSITSLAVSVFIGMSTSIILFCSHFHQVEDDLAAGKKSPIVRLGTATGAKVLKWATTSLYALTVLFVVFNLYPRWILLVFMSLPFAIALVNHVEQYHAEPDKVNNSKFLAINLHFVSGILLALGFILPH
ncbi:1,4-dihydroxy-2-naphthoate phytyltransferase [Gloeothece citriformis PCC 7424]|uniref:2-carboxy-1,4-naphthoquinone phytyltransferase n=1 Tax=Gloeothece citriformis (strain PCC 7424) TaxID=65393 RepID=B7KCZ1_GLOC7|nr:2-carboxy-1,4-naphthoquinone phytyltransferase [Gloeothece citriformis]ACK73112.1 1,4-dihydroxy-2-naphthoate phytyltransferase [Gloeothece citriformis PCC 7424]